MCHTGSSDNGRDVRPPGRCRPVILPLDELLMDVVIGAKFISISKVSKVSTSNFGLVHLMSLRRP